MTYLSSIIRDYRIHLLLLIIYSKYFLRYIYALYKNLIYFCAKNKDLRILKYIVTINLYESVINYLNLKLIKFLY